VKFFRVEPEVAGTAFGPNTIADVSRHPPLVTRLNYEFEGWLGDALVTSFPCFILTEEAVGEFNQLGLTGFATAPVEVSKGGQFDELQPGEELPKFAWLQVTGRPGVDDLGLGRDNVLVVSDRALNVLKRHGLSYADVSDVDAGA
jgi:hypothetical protein